MAALTGLFIADSYKALLKTIDNDVLGAAAKEIVDGYGNVSGVLFDTSGNVTINGNFRALDAILDSSGNAGTAGQVLTTTGTTTQWQSLSSVSGVTGSGTAGYLPLWSTNSALTNSIAIQSGATITIGGTLTATTKINTPILQLTGGTGAQGTFSWNADEETVDLVQNGTTTPLNQATELHVKNQTGATIAKGTPVRAAGTLGASGRILIAPMIANGTIEAKYFLGVTNEAIADGEEGKVITFGKIKSLNTAAYTEGQTLWVSSTVAGAFTTTRPVAPNLDLEVAIVINSHVNNGTIFVRATNGHYLGTAHDVNISSVAENDLLVYKTNRWVNTKTIGDLTAANVTLSGYLRGPATFVIDPAAYGDETGLVQILGDLRVDGTTTTINSTTISVSDKNITLAKDAVTAGDANGAGITIAGASATLTYLSATDDFTFNKNVNASRFVGPLTGDVTGTVSTLSNHDTDDLDEGTTNLYFTTARARASFSAGTGVSIASGVISIGQSVGTTDNVTFGIVTASLSGNASTASALQTARNIAIDGSVTGNADFDGSGNITITTTTNHNHDDRYYTETEVGNFFSGTTAITGYNKTNWDSAYSYSQIGHLPLTGGTLTGQLTLDDKLTITGTTNNFVIDEEADGTWHLYDTFQDNGIVLHSGSGGMDFQYNGVTEMTIDGGGVSFTGTINLDAADLNIGAADIIFDTVSGGAVRGLIWNVAGEGFLSKITSGGIDSGKVTIYTNIGTTTVGSTFEIYGANGLGLSLSNSGVLTAGGGTSAQWNTAYNYSTIGHLPLAGGTLSGQLTVGGNLFVGGSDTNNYIAFRGTTGDQPGNFNHTYIGEYLYAGTEQSELLLFKGNDPVTSGPDRIRYIGSTHVFQTYTTPLSGTFTEVATSALPITRLTINNDGSITAAGSITSTDYRATDAVYITSDGDDAGSNAIILRHGPTGEIARFNADKTFGLTKSSGTIISTGAGSDAFGYEPTYGHYIQGTAGKYIYGSGVYWDGAVHRTLIHSGNIAAQSVLYADNADTLDNLDSSQFLRSDQSDTMSGTLTVTGDVSIGSTQTVHVNRGKVGFSSSLADFNHVIYNNHSNIDGEGSWDGMKFNVYNGASFRIGTANSVVPTTAFYIDSDGDIGVGTANPTIHAGGNGFVVAGKSGVGAGRAVIEIVEAAAGSRGIFQQVNESTYVGNLNGNGKLILLSGGTGTSANESVTILANGNTGIGQTNPAYKLQVSGIQNANDVVINNTTTGVNLRLQMGDGYGGIFTTGDKSLWLGTNNTVNHLVINSTGSVGIGTNSPDYKLHVAGAGARFYNVSVGGSVTGSYANYSDAVVGFDNLHLAAQGAGAVYVNTAIDRPTYINPVGGSVAIGTFALNGVLNVSGGYTYLNGLRLSGADNAATIWKDSGDMGIYPQSGKLYLGSQGTQNVITVTSTSVGIGTTSPYSRLTVSKGGINQGAISYEDESNNAHLTISGADALVRLQFGTYNNGTYASWIQSSYDNSPGGSGSSGAQGLAINPQGGNVGIGTTSPSEKLHLYTNITESSGVGTVLKLTSDGPGGDNGWIGVNKGTGNGLELSVENRDIIFNTGASTPFGGSEKMRITSTGNVGIGTTNIRAKLEVADSTGNSSIIAGGLEMQSYSVNNSWYAENVYYSGAWKLRSAGYATQMYMQAGRITFVRFPYGNAGDSVTPTNTLTLAPSGYVGVGIEPTAKLHVDGTLRAEGQITAYNHISVINSAIEFGGAGSAPSTDPAIYRISGINALAISIGSVERMRISSNGYVGIGGITAYGQLSMNNQVSGGTSPVSSYAAGSGIGLGQNFFNGYYASGSDGLGTFPRYFDIVSTGYPDGTNGGSNIRFFTNHIDLNSPAVERMRITSSGDVGIGATDFTDISFGSRKLKIAGNRATLGLSSSGGLATIAMYAGNTDAKGMHINHHTDGWTGFYQYTAGGYTMYLHQNGNVGLGTTNIGTEANLHLGAKGSSEGGQLVLQKGTSYTYDAHLDSYQDSLRILRGTNGTGTAAVVASFNLSTNTFTSVGDVYAYSDQRVKENVETIDNALDKVMSMRGVSYNRTDSDDKTKKIGVIAQEMQKILPEVVTEQEDGMLSVSYGNIVGVLIEAIKELKAEIDELKKQK